MYRILELNPQLQSFAGDIDLRMFLYQTTKDRLLAPEQTLSDFACAYDYFGFHQVDGGWVYREWAPSAYQLYLEGDFNNWNMSSHPLKPIGNGNWEIFLPGADALWEGCKVKTVVDANMLEGDFNNWNMSSHPLKPIGNGNWEIFLPGADALWEGCKVKTVVDANMTRTEHIPLYARRVVQDKNTLTFSCEIVDDRKVFPWTDQDFVGSEELYIYEAHVGMAQEEGKVGTYREFADLTLPRIKEAGYNTIQLMAIMEHPYYGSFGYQVSNFYAASSWFGKPEDLKYLVNKAHAMGLRVLLDVVHSHAVKNTAEGINMFDGTTWQFFHDGPKGDHPAWGTKCFD